MRRSVASALAHEPPLAGSGDAALRRPRRPRPPLPPRPIRRRCRRGRGPRAASRRRGGHRRCRGRPRRLRRPLRRARPHGEPPGRPPADGAGVAPGVAPRRIHGRRGGDDPLVFGGQSPAARPRRSARRRRASSRSQPAAGRRGTRSARARDPRRPCPRVVRPVTSKASMRNGVTRMTARGDAPLRLPVRRAQRDQRAAGTSTRTSGASQPWASRCSGGGHASPFSPPVTTQRASARRTRRRSAHLRRPRAARARSRPPRRCTRRRRRPLRVASTDLSSPRGASSVPMPPITRPRALSPATRGPTPSGVPVRITSPGSSVIMRLTYDDERRHVEDHVRGRAVLARRRRSTRHALGTRERRRASVSIHGPDGAERVEALGARELHVLLLEVARGHVARARVPEDVARARSARATLFARLPMTTASSASCSTRALSGGRTIAPPGPSERRRRLQEEQRLGRHLVAELLGVRRVVAADADDLRRRDRAERDRPRRQAARFAGLGARRARAPASRKNACATLEAGESALRARTQSSESHGGRA